MKAALESGSNYWNGSALYGTPEENSMTLLQRYYDIHPEDANRVVLNVKGCTDGYPKFNLNSSPEGVAVSIGEARRMLGNRGFIHQFEAARVDPKVEVEVTMEAMNKHIDAGDIGAAALSEVNAASIRRASKITKVGAVEIELSLWCTDALENGVVQACAELDIPILAYCKMWSLRLCIENS
jgi:pyridoxine 4-dehydrogenase